MASITNDVIAQVQIDENPAKAIAATAYGVCGTAAATVAKTVEMTGFSLIQGVTIHVKFTYSNTATNPTLNVNKTGAKNIRRYGTTVPTNSAATSWQAGSICSLTYDGESWILNNWLNDNTWRGIQNNLTSDSTTDSLSAAQGKALKTAIDSVQNAVDNLPHAMVFKGTLGTGGSATSLATAAAANTGFTYKVITAGTYGGVAAKVGDVLVSNGSAWILIPSGDDIEDTKNTAGSTNSTSKLFLVGATSQAANPQTYSNTAVYETAGQMNSTEYRVAEAVTLKYDSTNKCLNFVFA